MRPAYGAATCNHKNGQYLKDLFADSPSIEPPCLSARLPCHERRARLRAQTGPWPWVGDPELLLWRLNAGAANGSVRRTDSCRGAATQRVGPLEVLEVGEVRIRSDPLESRRVHTWATRGPHQNSGRAATSGRTVAQSSSSFGSETEASKLRCMASIGSCTNFGMSPVRHQLQKAASGRCWSEWRGSQVTLCRDLTVRARCVGPGT